MYIDLNVYMVFLLVMLRMTGMLVTNPIFGRRNVPSMVNVGLALVLAVCITTSMNFPALPELNLFNFLYMVVVELAVGMLAGFLIQLFFSVMIVGGEIIDMQLGLSMSKNFDPSTNTSISVTATMLNAMFILTFFLTNNHLTLIYMTAQTFNVIPLGTIGINPAVLYYIPSLFSSIMLFAIKLCLPIVVVEIIVTMAVGIIMRIIPQINIFVVNIQFKLLIGIFALVVLVAPMIAYLENLMAICFDRIQDAWKYFIPPAG